jgi:hypothetical protein
MTYQIVKVLPIHDDRDCITAWRSVRLPNAYETEACAQAIAVRISAEYWDEISVKVVPYGESAFGRFVPSIFPRVASLPDDCPF